MTFGFCEVEDAARLWAMNPKKTAAAMARLDELVRATVDRQGGFLFVIGGESFGAAFHRADDAAAWATELQLGVEQRTLAGRRRAAAADRPAHRRDRGRRGRLLRCCRERGAAARQRRARRPDPFVRSHCRPAGPQTTSVIWAPTGSMARHLPSRIFSSSAPGKHPPLRGRALPPRQHPAPVGTPHRARKDLDGIARLWRSRRSSPWSGRAGSARPGSP